MKAKAIILLLPFALFIIETISFPLQANGACKKMTCMKMMGHIKCPHQKDDCKKSKENSGNCSNSSECSLCPVCSIFVFQPNYELPLTSELFQLRFPSLYANYVSSYISDVWKPPNNYLPKA